MKSYFSKFTAMLFLAILLCVMFPPFQFQAFTNTPVTFTPSWPVSGVYRIYGSQTYDFTLAGMTSDSSGWISVFRQVDVLASELNDVAYTFLQRFSGLSFYCDSLFQCDFNFTVNTSLECDIMIYFLGYQYYCSNSLAYNDPVSLDSFSVFDAEPRLVYSNHVPGSSSVQTFVARPVCRARDFINYIPSALSYNKSGFVNNRGYSLCPMFRIIVTSPASSCEVSFNTANYKFILYPEYGGRNADNSYYYTYFRPFPPYVVSDSRFLLALQNIWSAINGQGTGNLSSDIASQTQEVTQGFTDITADTANNNLNSYINNVDNAEEQSMEEVEANFDNFVASGGLNVSFADDALNAMAFFKESTDSILGNNGLFSALIVAAFTFFVVAVVAGVRRFI